MRQGFHWHKTAKGNETMANSSIKNKTLCTTFNTENLFFLIIDLTLPAPATLLVSSFMLLLMSFRTLIMFSCPSSTAAVTTWAGRAPWRPAAVTEEGPALSLRTPPWPPLAGSSAPGSRAALGEEKRTLSPRAPSTFHCCRPRPCLVVVVVAAAQRLPRCALAL